MDTPTSVAWGNDGTDPATPPVAPFLHMWTDPDDQVSRIALSTMTGFGRASLGGGAAPQWIRPFPGTVETVQFAILPVGWVGQWHESPHPQWVIPLRGRWFIETMDGTRVEMGPGDLHYGQDQNTTGNAGHLSGQVGDEPCLQMMIQFSKNPAAATPHPFGAPQR